MKCPICTTSNLVMTERQGIEIDYCPTCRGIWLDRGELDKILNKAMDFDKGNPAPHAGQPPFQDYGRGSSPYHKHRRKHWLHELFD
ncbi:MAG TPA: zf-TFIIB domain-containing protein [Bacteroidales bacterium]|nr:zf-TFIIB domain-containing protein [Bacteroidales bacterium]